MRETSPPVAILHQGAHLVVSIRATLDDTQMMWFRRELSHALDARTLRGVLIDVAALDVLDSFGARTICQVAGVARLRGAKAVIVGVGPQLALSMAQLGVGTGDIRTALDVTDGLDVMNDADWRSEPGARLHMRRARQRTGA